MTTFQTLIIILLTSIFFACSGQERTDKTAEQQTSSIHLDSLPYLKSIVHGIEKGNSVESAHIGYGGSPSDQYAKYEQLKTTATIEQLTALTDHNNSAVRCYAFQALASKKADNVFKVLLNHLHDTAAVYTQSGCLGLTYFTGDYFIDVVTPNYIDLEVYKLNPKEQQILDSILLYDTTIILSAKYSVLGNLKPIAANYYRIRELVAKDRNEAALKTLAKYQKQNDKELIASFFKDDDTQSSALYAVREFPDAYFYPYVKKVFEQEWNQEYYDYQKWRICYQALAQYPRPETIELFERTVNSTDEFRYETLCQYLLVAITKYPNKLYNPLKSKIKLSDYQMDEVKDELDHDY